MNITSSDRLAMDEAVFIDPSVHRKTVCRLVAATAVGLDMPTSVFISRRRAILGLAGTGLDRFNRRRINNIDPAFADAYVAFISDVFARKIGGWRVSTSMTTSFVLDALNQAG